MAGIGEGVLQALDAVAARTDPERQCLDGAAAVGALLVGLSRRGIGVGETGEFDVDEFDEGLVADSAASSVASIAALMSARTSAGAICGDAWPESSEVANAATAAAPSTPTTARPKTTSRRRCSTGLEKRGVEADTGPSRCPFRWSRIGVQPSESNPTGPVVPGVFRNAAT